MKSAINSDDYTLADFFKSENPDLFAKTEAFSLFLDDWQRKGTYSYHRLIRSACTTTATVRDRLTGFDRKMLVLASNNYLGLNTRPELVKAATEAINKYGTGMCGSRFLSGTYDLIEELERQLAQFEHCEAAMVFTTGYQANVGTISALLRPDDIAFIDRLSHASIVDGCRLSGCAYRSFRHNDMNSLERLLAKAAGKRCGKLIIVDGIFSMDGDMAPLSDIVGLARKYGAYVMVDEAHATGVVGETGRGTVEHFGLHGQVDIILGTFSKTLAATGGFIASYKKVVNYVRQYGRAYAFSAAPTPAVSATVLAALDIIRNEPSLRRELWANVRYFHRRLKELGFNVFPDPPQSAILTIVVGPDTTVRNISKDLYDAGIFASIVVYPAVAPNRGTLRLSLSAAHTRKDFDYALDVLKAIGKRYGIARENDHENTPDPARPTGQEWTTHEIQEALSS